MLTVRLKIDSSGTIYDTAEHWGLVYLSSDHILGAPAKAFESTTYPEQEGENLLPKTVDDAFDYKVKFFIKADSLANANEKIAAFNSALYTKETGKDTKVFKQVYFYNDYKRTLIVGYPQPISEATDFWRDKRGSMLDVVVVEWTIRVNKPSLCNFNLTTT